MRKLLIFLWFLPLLTFGQKCLVKENQIISLGLPSSYNSIIGTVTYGYGALSDSIHYADGWREIIVPNTDSLHYLGQIYYNFTQDVCTYPVIAKTQQQLNTEIKSKYEALDSYVDFNSVKKLLQVTLRSKLDSLSDDELKAASTIFQVWMPGTSYKANEIISYDTIVYRVIQPHTSQIDWKPNTSKSLFTPYRPPNSINPFVQPTGAHDAYKKGDKVLFNSSTYESLIDNNVWSPTTYPQGWKKL